tara:strand:+ start:536 stop:964 length:429 start_codon:yes stop_codon:yes gene_type:complete
MRDGLSANAIIKQLAGGEFSIRRATGLQLAREFRGVESKKNLFRFIRPDFKPDVQNISPGPEGMKRQFSYQAKYNVRSNITGQTNESFVRFSDDRLLTMEEQRARFDEIARKAGFASRDDFGGSSVGEVESFETLGVFQKAA